MATISNKPYTKFREKYVTIDALKLALNDFGASLEAKLNAKFEKIDQRFEKIDQRFEKIDQRFEKIEDKLDKIDDKVNSIDKRLISLEVKDSIYFWIHTVAFSGIFACLGFIIKTFLVK